MKKRNRIGSIAMGAALLLLLVGVSAAAQTFNYITVDVPNSTYTSIGGIGPAGQMVGIYLDSNGNEHGFLYSNGQFTTLDAPGTLVGLSASVARVAEPNGINAAGDIVGDYIALPGDPGAPLCGSPEDVNGTACVRGFLLRRGKWSNVLVPGKAGSIPNSINSDDSIYGCDHNFDFGTSMVGFVRTRLGTYKTLDAGGGILGDLTQPVVDSMANGATPDGKTIIGLYLPPNELAHGFVVQNGVFNDYMVPGSMATQVWGINAEGDFVGIFRDIPGPTGVHGFLQRASDSAPVLLNYPSAVRTYAFAINSSGVIVGAYVTDNTRHGYVAVPASTN